MSQAKHHRSHRLIAVGEIKIKTLQVASVAPRTVANSDLAGTRSADDPEELECELDARAEARPSRIHPSHSHRIAYPVCVKR